MPQAVCDLRWCDIRSEVRDADAESEAMFMGNPEVFGSSSDPNDSTMAQNCMRVAYMQSKYIDVFSYIDFSQLGELCKSSERGGSAVIVHTVSDEGAVRLFMMRFAVKISACYRSIRLNVKCCK